MSEKQREASDYAASRLPCLQNACSFGCHIMVKNDTISIQE